MFNWEVIAEARAKANAQDVWKLWSDVATWTDWSQELEWCRLEGPFAIGSTGSLKPKGWPVSKFIITEMEEGKSFSDDSFMPMTKMTFSHELITEGDEIRIIHRVKVKGLLAPLLWLTMRGKMQSGLPKKVQLLAARVQK